MRNLKNFSRRKVIRSMRSGIVAIAVACAAISTPAQPPAPELTSTQVIRVWAYNGLSSQLLRWESEYSKLHPEVRFDNQLHGAAAVMAADLAGEYAQHVQRIRLIRLSRQDLPIDRLGFLETTGLVMLNRQSKRLLDRYRRHALLVCLAHHCRQMSR